MTAAAWPLQQAIYTKVTSASTVMDLVTGLFDEVPEGQPYPYISFGSITEVQDDAHGQAGLATEVVLHIWSAYRGNKEAAQILAALTTVLHRQPLTVAGYEDVSIAHVRHQSLRDPDPAIRHINVAYRVWMTEE